MAIIFPAIVLLPSGTTTDRKKLEKKLERHLAPYDFANNVIDYDEECHRCKGKPSKDCSLCKGTGYYWEKANPKGEFEYWTFGGEWDGRIKGNPPAEDNEEGLSAWSDAVAENNLINKASDINSFFLTEFSKYTDCAIVSPKGEWIKFTDQGQDDRENKVRDVISKYGHCMALMLEMAW